MKTLLAILVSTVVGLGAFGLLAASASAAGIGPAEALDPPAQVILVGSDCYAIGEQVAAENGGTLAKASQSTQDGQPVCVIVVLVPGKDGQRPRRTEVVVPQG